MTELRRRRKELGLCTECGKPAREGKTTCADCMEKHSAADRRRFVERNGREPVTDYKLKTEYIFTAWNGRHVVKRGTAKELGEFFGMSATAVHEYARRGIRRRKDGVFFERERICERGQGLHQLPWEMERGYREGYRESV